MFCALPVGKPQQREPFPGCVKLQELIRAATPQGSAGNQSVKLQFLRGPGHSRELLELSRDSHPASTTNDVGSQQLPCIYSVIYAPGSGMTEENSLRKFFWQSSENDNIYSYEQKCRKDCFPVWVFFSFWFLCSCFPSTKSWGVFQTFSVFLNTLLWRKLLLGYDMHRNRFCKWIHGIEWIPLPQVVWEPRQGHIKCHRYVKLNHEQNM